MPDPAPNPCCGICPHWHPRKPPNDAGWGECVYAGTVADPAIVRGALDQRPESLRTRWDAHCPNWTPKG